jgi:hypothetical protein
MAPMPVVARPGRRRGAPAGSTAPRRRNGGRAHALARQLRLFVFDLGFGAAFALDQRVDLGGVFLAQFGDGFVALFAQGLRGADAEVAFALARFAVSRCAGKLGKST